MDGSRSWSFFETPVWHVDAARGPSTPSLDHLVGALLEKPGHVEAKRLGGLKIDDQLELCWLLHWEIGGVGAFERLADINAYLAISLREAGCVTHQATGSRILAPRVDRGHCVAGGQGDNLVAPIEVIPILAHNQRIDPRCLHGGEGHVEITVITGGHFSDLKP